MRAPDEPAKNRYRGCSIFNMHRLVAGITFSVVMIAQSLSVSAQDEYPDKTVDAEMQCAIIDSVTHALNELYVYPDVAREMERYVRRQYEERAYRGITSAVEFTQKLTEDLLKVSSDAHLKVEFAPDDVFEDADGEQTDEEPNDEELREQFEDDAFDNFGFLEVKRLWGNVGYLKMNGFYDADWGGSTVAAAMGFVANCDALIIDLRLTLGGSPTMVQLLCSYFFEEPVELSAIYNRPEDRTKQQWTYAHVSGPRLADVDLFILTSEQTPSAAEQFVYDMQALERATVIGAKTRGAAHLTMHYGMPELNILISIPHGRAVSPITGTNWEGVGVEPDVHVSPDQALDVAHVRALQGLIEKCANKDTLAKLEWAVEWVDGHANPAALNNAELEEYAGTYGPRTFTVVEDHLEYRRGKNRPYTLIPIGNDVFLFEDLYYLRFHFLRNESGEVAEVVSQTEDGPSSRYARTPRD